MFRPTKPQQLPELRAEIVRNDNLWAAQQAIAHMLGRRDFEQADNMRVWLKDADLWWVDDDACELLEEAAPSMPPATLTVDFLPHPCGFVAFAHPLKGMSSDSDMTLYVDYMFWYPATVEGEEAISITCWTSHGFGIEEQTMIPVALGRSDWPIMTDTDFAYDEEILNRAVGTSDANVSQTMLSIIEDRRWLAALWQLSSQRNVTESAEVRPDRPSHKRIVRMGGNPSPVRVIYLPAHAHAAPVPGGARVYRHRWYVGKHWRQQAYGPGRSLRRPILIMPHIKGPPGAPLLPHRETVHVLTTDEADAD